MRKVFLGGTVGESNWRGYISYSIKFDAFNPVVVDWSKEDQEIENDEKENKCDIHLYVITKDMKGVYSIAEVVDSVHNKSKTTILQVLPDGFDEFQLKSLQAVVDLVKSRGGIAFMDDDLRHSVRVINNLPD